MTVRNPDPVTSRHLEKDGEMLYVVVERLNEQDIQGELFRLRAHRHPAGTPRRADWNNVWETDETGNRYVLRDKLIKLLLDKRDEGWKTVGAPNPDMPTENDFWRLDL